MVLQFSWLFSIIVYGSTSGKAFAAQKKWKEDLDYEEAGERVWSDSKFVPFTIISNFPIFENLKSGSAPLLFHMLPEILTTKLN